MKGKIRAAIGIALSLLLLWWALRDVSFAEVGRRIAAADPLLFSLSLVVALTAFPIRAFRWGILLLPGSGPVSFSPRNAATFIGFAVNNLLPARVGEFARAYTLSRLTQVRIGSAIATMVIERMLDGIVVVGLLFFAMAAPGFPAGGAESGVRSAALMMGLVMVAIGVALFVAVAAPSRAAAAAYAAVRVIPSRFQEAALNGLRSFAAGLGALRSGRLFVISALLALAQWVWLGLSFHFSLRAFGIEQVPFSGSLFLQSLIGLAVAVPSSPGFFGPFEAGARVGLGLWDVLPEQAISWAIGFHIGGFIPVTLIGLWFISSLNLSWSAMAHSEEAVEEATTGAAAGTESARDPHDRGIA